MKKTILCCILTIASTALLHAQLISEEITPERMLLKIARDSGTQVPSAVLKDANGKRRNLSEFKGKVIYLNIWASWCGGCLASFPRQEWLLKRMKVLQSDTAVVFVNINIDETESIWKSALKKYKPAGINWFSKDSLLYEKWGIAALPAHIFIDKSGLVLAKKVMEPGMGGIDYSLYALATDQSLTIATKTMIEQSRLMAANRSNAALTDSTYARWLRTMTPYMIEEFLHFQGKQKKQ